MNNRRNGVPGGRENARPGGPEVADLSTDVRVWKVNKVKSKKAPYQLRWIVAGKVKTANFAGSNLVRRTPTAQCRSRPSWSP